MGRTKGAAAWCASVMDQLAPRLTVRLKQLVRSSPARRNLFIRRAASLGSPLSLIHDSAASKPLYSPFMSNQRVNSQTIGLGENRRAGQSRSRSREPVWLAGQRCARRHDELPGMQRARFADLLGSLGAGAVLAICPTGTPCGFARLSTRPTRFRVAVQRLWQHAASAAPLFSRQIPALPLPSSSCSSAPIITSAAVCPLRQATLLLAPIRSPRSLRSSAYRHEARRCGVTAAARIAFATSVEQQPVVVVERLS